MENEAVTEIVQGCTCEFTPELAAKLDVFLTFFTAFGVFVLGVLVCIGLYKLIRLFF
jgi:hypothetical protein